MADTKRKGDLAELRVASDLLRQGHRVAIAFGEDWDFDLVLYRANGLERVQVKYVESDGNVVHIECRSRALTKGRIVATKRYNRDTIDWLAVYDKTSDQCFYVPAELPGAGRSMISLRLRHARNGQRVGINYASDFDRISQAETSGASRIRTDGLLLAKQAL